jgi:hypothetical protein
MSIGQALSEAIATWLDDRKSRSLGMLSRLSQTSNSTVRRAAQAEGEISMDRALAIASVVMPDHAFRQFVGTYCPALKRFVADVNHPRAADSLHGFLNSEGHFKVIVLSSTPRGTSEQEVKEKFGEVHVAYLSDLIDSGHLTKVAPDRWSFQGDLGDVSFELARKCLSTLTTICDKRNDSLEGASTAWVGWQNLNAAAARKVNGLLAKCVEDIFTVFNNKDNHGDVLVFCGLLLNALKGQEKLI